MRLETVFFFFIDFLDNKVYLLVCVAMHDLRHIPKKYSSIVSIERELTVKRGIRKMLPMKVNSEMLSFYYELGKEISLTSLKLNMEANFMKI